MNVIEDQHHGRILRGQPGGELEQEIVISRELAPRACHWLGDGGSGSPQRCREVGPEDGRLVIVTIERDPGDGARMCGRPRR